MKRIAAFLFLHLACNASQVIMSGSGSKKDGAQFRYETRIEPEIAGQKLTGFGEGGLVVNQRFHRFLSDRESKRFYGYDLDVSKQPDGKTLVMFYPLSLTAQKLLLKDPAAWTQIPTPQLPANQSVSDSSEAIRVDLFLHPVTGQRIIDYLYFDGKPSSRIASMPLRDFTVDDAPLTFAEMKFRLNGKAVEGMDGGGISGEAVFFYLPGRGRYVMSLAPNADLGFRKAGEIRGNEASVTIGSDTFRVECKGPIAPGGGAFHLYVHYDPAWRPRDGVVGPMWGAALAKMLVRPSNR
ncbi:MAG: hypothetical protein U0Q16_00260 [Bryobacteraceae bacterium]